MIIVEIGDFNNFDSSDKILTFAELSPSTYQSDQINNCYSSHIVPKLVCLILFCRNLD